MPIEIYREGAGNFREEIGKADQIRLSSMGTSVPQIRYYGTYISVEGVGGPLHVVFEGHKIPEPISTPLTPNAAVRELNTVVACLVKMMGGAVTIHDFEFNQADSLHMTQWYDDTRRLTIKVEDR